MKDQKKRGILLSYINIFLGTCVNLIITPILISTLTDEAYSIYKVMQSFSGPLIMFNLGLSTIVARSVAKCHSAEDEKEKENTLAMAIIVSIAMAVLVVVIGLFLKSQVSNIYGGNYNAQQINMAEDILLIFVLSTAIHIVSDTFRGCVTGNERFVFYYGTSTLQYVLRFCFIFLFLKLGFGACGVALVDLINNIIILLANIIYSLCRLKEHPRLYYWDKKELINIFSFSVAILLQAIINQVNNNVDIMILGAMESNKEIITMYSSALTIYGVYNSMITVFANVYFPQAAKLVSQHHSSEELTDFIISPGRIQAVVAVGVVGAFALFGQNFITLWIGEKYINAYYVALILLIPVSIPLVQNVCLSILDAKLKRLFRSVVLTIMSVINIIVSIVLIHYMGFWGAAIGTAISLIIGHIIIMNIYYSRVVNIQVIRMFKGIFKGILPMGILTMIVCIPLNLLLGNTVVLFLIKCLVFVVIYFALLWKWGLNDNDRSFLLGNRTSKDNH